MKSSANSYFVMVYSGGMWLVCAELESRQQAQNWQEKAQEIFPEKQLKTVSFSELANSAKTGYSFFSL